MKARIKMSVLNARLNRWKTVYVRPDMLYPNLIMLKRAGVKVIVHQTVG